MSSLSCSWRLRQGRSGFPASTWRFVRAGPRSSSAANSTLRLTIRRDFPFPKSAWVQPRCDIAIGRAPRLNGSWGALSLGDAHTHIGSMGGSYKGAPTARALLEVREVDHTKGGKVLWTARWSLGPLKLRRVP